MNATSLSARKPAHQTCVAMTYIFSAAAVLLALLGAELWMVLVAVALIIIQVLLVIGFIGYYAKEGVNVLFFLGSFLQIR